MENIERASLEHLPNWRDEYEARYGKADYTRVIRHIRGGQDSVESSVDHDFTDHNGCV